MHSPQRVIFPAEYKGILKEVYDFSRKNKVSLYLVGGILRDLFLSRRKKGLDFDFALKKDSIVFGRRLASQLRAGFVLLDKEHGACRVVKKAKDGPYTFDFTDFRGGTLEDDLAGRDFTINSMAIPFEAVWLKNNINAAIIDPHGARKDLEGKLIRTLDKANFDEDPLRMLRAFSFACIFGFRIEKKTLSYIKSRVKKLNDVSGERIRDELFKILGESDSFSSLIVLEKLSILDMIIPEIKLMRNAYQGPYHHLDILEHSLEGVKQFELLVKELKRNYAIGKYLTYALAAERKRASLIKLGIILHDIGKPKAKRQIKGKLTFYGHEAVGRDIVTDIGRRLRLSNDEVDSLRRMVFFHMRPGHLAGAKLVTSRARFRYFRDAGEDALAVLLLSLADQRSTQGPLTSKESHGRHERLSFALIKEYLRKEKTVKPARLITGDDLLAKFKLNPSPLIGKVLAEIEELQGIGKLKTKQTALKIAGQIIKRESKRPVGLVANKSLDFFCRSAIILSIVLL